MTRAFTQAQSLSITPQKVFIRVVSTTQATSLALSTVLRHTYALTVSATQSQSLAISSGVGVREYAVAVAAAVNQYCRLAFTFIRRPRPVPPSLQPWPPEGAPGLGVTSPDTAPVLVLASADSAPPLQLD
jgi:hypothetical protein